MFNAIPIVGWLFSTIFAVSLAVPFWCVWTLAGIGQTFAYWLPPVYQHPGFWQCVGVFIAVPIIKAVFVPKIAMVTSESK